MIRSVIADEISSDLEQAFSVIHAKGFTHTELHNVFGKSIEELTDQETEEVKRLLEQYELQVSDLASTVFFLCPLQEGDEVRGFSESFHAVSGSLQEHLNWLRRACKIAEKLNCPNIRLFPFRFPENRKPPFGTESDMEKIVSAMRMASEAAGEYDVTLVVENCPYSHLPKGEMTLELIKRVNRDNVKLLYDPANSYRAVKENVPEKYLGWDLLTETRQVVSKTGHMHVKDYHYDPSIQPKPFLHVVAGSGDIDYPGIFRIMKAHGCAHACSLEPEVGPEGAVQSMDWLSQIL